MSICPRCGILFNPSRTQIYCTDYCARKASKLRNRQRHAKPRVVKLKPAKKVRWRRPRIWAYKPTIADRLLAHSIPEPNSGCLFWLGKVSKKGYAMIWVDGKHRIAPRVAYEMAKGPVPEGKMVCHHCDTPVCIEPNHLYAGTARTNYDDMVKRGRRQAPYTKKDRPPPKPKPSAYGRKRYAGAGI